MSNIIIVGDFKHIDKIREALSIIYGTDNEIVVLAEEIDKFTDEDLKVLLGQTEFPTELELLLKQAEFPIDFDKLLIDKQILYDDKYYEVDEYTLEQYNLQKKQINKPIIYKQPYIKPRYKQTKIIR